MDKWRGRRVRNRVGIDGRGIGIGKTRTEGF